MTRANLGFRCLALCLVAVLSGCGPQRVDFRGAEGMDRIVGSCAELAFATGAARASGQVNDFRSSNITASQTRADVEDDYFEYEVIGEVSIFTSVEEVFVWSCHVSVDGGAELVARIVQFDPKAA